MQCAFCDQPAIAKIEGTPMCAEAVAKVFAIRRRKRLLAIGASFLTSVLFSLSVHAAELLTTRTLPTDIMLSPPHYTGMLDGPVIGPRPSRWHLAQWGIRDAFTVDRVEIRADGWRLWTEDASLTLQTGPDTRREWEIWQTSAHPDYGCREFDLFLEPNTHFSYPGSAPGLREWPRSLAALPRLNVTFAHEVVDTWQGARCQYNVSNVIIGLVFVNLTSSPPQAFFYQVATYDSRGETFIGAWFYTGWQDGGFKNYGAVDSVEHFGYRALTPGAGRAAFDLNLLARVRELIASNPYGMERDLAQWHCRGFYGGTAVTGEAAIRARLGTVRLYSE